MERMVSDGIIKVTFYHPQRIKCSKLFRIVQQFTLLEGRKYMWQTKKNDASSNATGVILMDYMRREFYMHEVKTLITVQLLLHSRKLNLADG